MSELLLPVGYRCGVGGGYVPSSADDALVVRLGADQHGLAGDEAVVWDEVLTAAGGRGRDDVLALARDFGAREPSAAVDGLLVRGLAVLVEDTPSSLEEFARGHRFGALRQAVDPGEAAGFELQLQPGSNQPAIALDDVEHAVWRYAPVARTLWEAAAQEGPLARLSAEPHDRIEVIAAAIAALVKTRSCYLDTARIATHVPDAPAPKPGLDEDAYKRFVTGTPGGVGYLAEFGGVQFDFDGVLDGKPVYTVADLTTKFAGRPAARFWPQVIAAVAATQVAVTRGDRAIWAMQHVEDARFVRGVLARQAASAIDVRHVPTDPVTAPDSAMAAGQASAGALRLDEDDYKLLITGVPNPIKYVVDDREGREYDFDGLLDGAYVFTIADVRTRLSPDEAATRGDTTQSLLARYEEAAREQARVAAGYPVLWYVQRKEDAAMLTDMLSAAGIDQITMRQRA